MKKVIIINGVAQSGKDTFMDFFIEYSDKFDEISLKRSTIDKTKETCFELFNANPEEKTDINRRLWSDFKTMHTRYSDGPFREIVSFIDENHLGDYFFIAAREPAEISKFKKYYKDKCLTLLIKRDGLSVPDNFGDKNVNNFNYDLCIKNNTLEELKQSVINLFDKFNEEDYI